MDRTALSKRLEGLSQVFADGNPMARDLKAMSYVLSNMSDEKFANVLNAGFNPDMPMPEEEDKEAVIRGMQPTPQSRVPQMMQQRQQRQERTRSMGEPSFEPRDPKAALEALMANPTVQQAVQGDPKLQQAVKMASEEEEVPETAETTETAEASEETSGGYWNKDASTAVMAALVEDVMGREAMEKSICCNTNMHLTKDQTPDGEHKQETPSSLKPDQVPHIDESLDSNILAKSKQTPLKKEAADDDDEEDKDAAKKKDSGLEELKELKKEKAEEKAEDLSEGAKEDAGSAKKKLEKAEESEEKAEDLEDKDSSKKKDATEEPDKEATEEDDKEATEKEEEPILASEGVELVPPMQEVELSEAEAKKLSALFAE